MQNIRSMWSKETGYTRNKMKAKNTYKEQRHRLHDLLHKTGLGKYEEYYPRKYFRPCGIQPQDVQLNFLFKCLTENNDTNQLHQSLHKGATSLF